MRDDRTALIACSAIRVILLGMPVETALDAALEKAGVQVSEIERRQLLRDIEQVIVSGRWPDKPGQLDIAI